MPENIYGGLILFEREAAGDLFRYFDRFIDDAPREYGGYPAWHLAPPLPFIPANRVGEPFPVLVSCWTGDTKRARRYCRASATSARSWPSMSARSPTPR